MDQIVKNITSSSLYVQNTVAKEEITLIVELFMVVSYIRSIN